MKKRFLIFVIAGVFILLNCQESDNPLSNYQYNNHNFKTANLQKVNFQDSRMLKVFRTQSQISIDGSENEWTNIPKHRMKKYFLTDNPYAQEFPNVGKQDLSAYFMVLWDFENLYVFCKIIDDEINVNADPSESWLMDSFEIFLDCDNSKNAPNPGDPIAWPGTYDANDDQIRFVWEKTPIISRNNFDISKIEFAYKLTKYGWNIELKIPSAALVDFNMEHNKEFGLELHINDNDGGSRQNMLKWWSDSDYTWLYPSLFGTAKLYDYVIN